MQNKGLAMSANRHRARGRFASESIVTRTMPNCKISGLGEKANAKAASTAQVKGVAHQEAFSDDAQDNDIRCSTTHEEERLVNSA
jgi:hypothetical protein